MFLSAVAPSNVPATSSNAPPTFVTQELIEKNVEAVNKLQQKINERGLVEKLGYNFAKYADILTGGTVRGFIGGILPRGAGYKTMNALDLEDALRGNLDIVEKALKSKTDKELINNLNQLKSSVDESARSTSSLNKKTTATTNATAKSTNIDSSISQTTNKASGKLGGFAQVTKENPAYKITPEIKADLDLIINSAKDTGKVSKQMFEDTSASLRELFPGEKITPSNASDYAKLAFSFRELERGNLSKKAMQETIKRFEKATGRKLDGFSELGLLPKLALGTAVATGALKAGVEYKKSTEANKGK